MSGSGGVWHGRCGAHSSAASCAHTMIHSDTPLASLKHTHTHIITHCHTFPTLPLPPAYLGGQRHLCVSVKTACPAQRCKPSWADNDPGQVWQGKGARDEFVAHVQQAQGRRGRSTWGCVICDDIEVTTGAAKHLFHTWEAVGMMGSSMVWSNTTGVIQ